MITWKQKYHGVLVLLPLSLALFYSWFASGTLETLDKVRRLERDLTRMEGISSGLAATRTEMERLEKIIQRNEMNDTLDILFSHLIDYCARHGVLLRDYSPVHVVTRQNYSCYTRVITLDGGFQELLYLIDHVENEWENQLQSVSFEVIPARGKLPVCLRLKLYVQFISW
ncbi:MAG: hypothetical protein LBP56_01175 [Odoribacteraceae bacterium]|jgi:hypothetical protein|nr:hypothetical protein [Odoribacteraceae bacterium]